MKLSGLKALVTGASRGIGKEIAIAFAREGADIVINYRARSQAAEAVATEIKTLGRNVHVVQADVSKFDEVETMKKSIETNFGKIDILVNNAGINIDKLFRKMEYEMWSNVIDVNLTGVFNCTKVFLDHVVESRQGRIINISSIIGQRGNIGQVNYAASKAGILGFTKALALELATKGVTVNAIAPGFIETEMVIGIPDKVKEKILAQIPLNRFGKPEEVAYAAVFLASKEAEYITGQVINVNGGMYL